MKSWKIWLLLGILVIFSSSAYAIKGCCEKTNSGLYCTTAEDTECAAGASFAPTACEQTSFCKLGCCYSSEIGRCFKSTPRAACGAQGNSTWSDSSACEIPQCKKGCCLIGDQASYVTDVRCKRTAGQFEGVAYKFDDTVKSEAECIDKARSQESGCCVQQDSCTFTTRAGCSTTSSEVTLANASRVGFHKDTLCSNDKLNCGCAKQSTTQCIGENVYWVDSCGNKENIYSSDKRASYNEGVVLKEESSCQSSSPNNPNCGNCDYGTGTICGGDKDKVMPVGSSTCVDINCEETYDDAVSPNAGKDKKNGESWCIFDTLPGQARDVAGSRHFRNLCLNGEEIVEPCKDFREELCIQGVSGGEVLRNLLALQSAFSDGQYIEAACRTNRNRDCNACNSLLEDALDKENAANNQGIYDRRKQCCDDETVRDCYWMPSSLTAQPGTCVAQVPRGLKFWGDAAAAASTASAPNSAVAGNGAPAATTPSSEAAQVCSAANQECEVGFTMSGLCRGGVIGEFAKAVFLWSTNCNWKITKNKQCTDHKWVVAGNNLCKAQGDCGAYLNTQGKLTKDGYVNTAVDEKTYFTGKPLTDAEVGDFDAISEPSKELGFFEKRGAAATASMITAGAGILLGGFSAAIAQNDISKFGTGVNPLMSTALSAFGSGGMGSVFTAAISGSQILSALGGDNAQCTGRSSPDTPRRSPSNTQPPVTVINEQDIAPEDRIITPSTSTGSAILDVTGAATDDDDNNDDDVNDGSEDAESARNDRISEFTIGAGKTLANSRLRSIIPNGDRCSASELNAMQTALQGSSLFAKEGGKTVASSSSFGSLMSVANTYFWLQGIATAVDLLFTKNIDRTYKVECKPWVAPIGGDDCEKCNDAFKPCSEYRCKALGSTCELVNKGTSNETCIALDVNDVNSPIITPLYQVLTPPFTLQEVTEEGNKGFKINERIRPFQQVDLGISLNEPGQCKYDTTPGKRFDQMSQQFGSSIFSYNQSLRLVLPAEMAQENVTKTTDGIFAFYIRCQDGRGNKNERDYFIKFQVDPSPDLTPPVIRYTSIQNNGYISNNVTEADLALYVDEPAECKWSKLDTGFEVMETSFTCSQDALQVSSLYGGTYRCDTKLTNLENKKNTVYIRCKDKPAAPDQNDRIANEDSYEFTLTGTNALKITSSGPTGILYSKKVLMTVTTAKGAENGNAQCGFSINDVAYEQMILFATSNGSRHEQLFTDQVEGIFKYYIKCRDIAGNEDSANVNFTVDVDELAPEITGLYADPLFKVVHIDFNEASTCEYRSQPGFVMGEGTPFGNANSTSIETTYRPEQPEPLYVLCKDIFDNQGHYEIFPLVTEEGI